MPYPARQSGIPIEEISREIVQRLIAEFGGKITADGNYWQGGRCPSCGKKSLWTLADKPLLPRCNHESKCGHSFSTRDQYPDLFENISQRYEPTPTNPNATADAYLRMIRGFDITPLAGWYQQAKYWNPKGKPGKNGSATVRFWLDQEKGVAWEKFVDKVIVIDDDGDENVRDSNFIGDYKGLAWTPPGFLVEQGTPVYIVEGIFDAIALYLNGYKQVVAAMSCGNFPEAIIQAFQHADPIWTLALDNDKAGREHTHKHIDRLKKLGARWGCIQPSQYESKLDWNDQHLRGQLASDDMKRYHYYGALLTAEAPEDAALATWRHTEQSFFVFDFKKQLYKFEFDFEKYTKALDKIIEREKKKTGDDDTLPVTDDMREEALNDSKNLQRIANCDVALRYSLRNPVDEKLYYFFTVRFPEGRVVTGKMAASDTVEAKPFRKKLADIASGGLMKANDQAHEWLLERWFRHILDVKTIPYAGYMAELNAYVYPAFAVHSGKICHRNTDEYIRLGAGHAIKSDFHDVKISPNFKLAECRTDWYDDLFTAWGYKGIAALAYFTASLITQQVRRRQTSFMFLEVVGDAGTGKSTLIEFLWRLFGRCDEASYEGFDPSSSRPAFVGRQLASISNMPTVFIEADRQEGKAGSKGAFDWENIKKLYGGKSFYNRAVATQGNETFSTPYLGSLVIAQNAPVDASEAVLTRLCHLYFKREDSNTETFHAARRLEAMRIEELSGYLLKCLTRIEQIEEVFFREQKQFEEQIRKQVWSKTVRIAFNHSQLAAAVACLRVTTDIDGDILDSTQQYIINQMAKEREQAIKKDHPYVEQFMRVLDFLEEEGKQLDHYKGDDDNIIAIRIGDVYELAGKFRQDLPPEIDMTKVLKTSRRYVRHNWPTGSKLRSGTVRCWWLKKHI